MIEGFRRLMRGETEIDFIGRSRLWLILSIAVVGVSLAGLLGRGLNPGLEFSGGTALTVTVRSDAGVPEFQEALAAEDVVGTAQIIVRPDGGREALIRTQVTSEEPLAALQGAIARTAGQLDAEGQPDLDAVSRTTVGPTWGEQITNKAVRGLIVFLVLVSLYISLRFEPKMAVGALAALFHDLLWTAGIYALVGFEVTPATVIALLTLMGYSLYDTVVVFDRVRENSVTLTSTSRITYSGMVNRSINEVLMRSVNTSISSVLPVAGLLFVGVFLFGAVTLRDLALAMFIGATVSTYSSIFVAVPILAWLKEREPQNQALRRRLEGKAAEPRRRRPSPAPQKEREDEAAPASPAAEDEDLEMAAPAREPADRRPAAGPGPRTPPRAPRRRRGKRRGKRR